MSERGVARIVCATRGGEASHRTQERAVELAKERNAELIFMCVVDPSFAGEISGHLADALEDELKRLGRALLNIAQARAKDMGVNARLACRSGPVADSIMGYLRETRAGTLVIGQPRSSMLQAFGPSDVEEFADRVRREMDIEVVLV